MLGAGEVTLLVAFLIGFFAVQFVIAIASCTLLNLGYEDTVTLSFTTTARNSEAVIGVAVVAFPGHPLVYLAIILGPVVELPVLLAISRMLLGLRGKVGERSALHLGSKSPKGFDGAAGSGPVRVTTDAYEGGYSK